MAQIEDYCEEGNLIYLLIKRVEGLSLDKILSFKREKEDFERYAAFMVKVLLQLSIALTQLERLRIYHRDIKEDNIMISFKN